VHRDLLEHRAKPALRGDRVEERAPPQLGQDVRCDPPPT
jgi:hypothetical protein